MQHPDTQHINYIFSTRPGPPSPARNSKELTFAIGYGSRRYRSNRGNFSSTYRIGVPGTDFRAGFDIDVTNTFYPFAKKEPASGGGMLADVNTSIGAFNAANGLKSELIEYAVRSNYKSARTWSEFNNLRSSQQAWRATNTLGKTGASYLKYVKGLGYVGAGLTTAYSVTNAYNYYNNGGTDWTEYAKSGLDVIMTGAGFLGPIGFGISATYFILDASTGGFGLIKP